MQRPQAASLYNFVVNSQGGTGLLGSSEAYGSFNSKISGITAYKHLFALYVKQERTIGTLVDNDKLAATHFYLGVNSRYQIALNNQFIVVSAPEINALSLITQLHCLITKADYES